MVVDKQQTKKMKEKMQHFELFAKRFIKVPNSQNEMVPFILHPEQKELNDNLAKSTILLKGRQIGGTTYGLAKMLHSAIIRPESNYIIVTHHADVSKSLFRKLKKMYAYLPHKKYPNLFPKEHLNNREVFELENGSRIIISTATGGDNISGNTFQMIHLSEMSKYPLEAQEEILSTSIAALAKNPEAVLLIESAGYGLPGLFQELFLKAWKDKNNIWKPLFFNWLSKGYAELFKSDLDEAEQHYKNQNKGKRLTFDDLDKEEKTLYEKHGASYRQLMWRRFMIERYKGSVQKFKENFPTVPEEAFLGKIESLFDKEKLIQRLNYVLPPISKDKTKLELPNLARYAGRELLVYHTPKRAERYWAGVDCAGGNGGNNDDSFIVVFDSNNEEVCSFSSNEVKPWEFADIVHEIATYYNMAYLTIERDTGNGNSVIDKLKNEYRYLNLHRDRKFNEGKRKSVIGFQPTAISKQMMINNLVELMTKEQILIHTKKILEQMMIFQDKDGKLGNKRGTANHDDGVIATALTFVGMAKKVQYCDWNYMQEAR